MRNILPFATIVLVLAAAAPALAKGNSACGDAPRAQWLSEEAIKAKGVELGYEVRRVKVEDGCYELYALDKNKAKVEVYLNPVTGALVNSKTQD
jgi:hypothetical protein